MEIGRATKTAAAAMVTNPMTVAIEWEWEITVVAAMVTIPKAMIIERAITAVVVVATNLKSMAMERVIASMAAIGGFFGLEFDCHLLAM